MYKINWRMEFEQLLYPSQVNFSVLESFHSFEDIGVENVENLWERFRSTNASRSQFCR